MRSLNLVLFSALMRLNWFFLPSILPTQITRFPSRHSLLQFPLNNVVSIAFGITENGFVIGFAQEDYTGSDKNQIGKVLVAIDPHFAQINNNLFSSLFVLPRLSFSATPLNMLPYTIAALVGVASFIIAFRFFGKATLAGVQAMGRNPLAKKEIIFLVIINAGLTVSVMLVGFVVAYIILVI